MKPRRSRRRRLEKLRLRFRLAKAMFVLPNLFTCSSIFCGFYAILLVSGTPGPAQFYQATLATFFATFFDMVDGRVARLTRTQSDFGVQLDSLADVISFGVTPAVIVYHWALSNWGLLGMLVAFVYIACGAVRLARFNVIAARAGGGSGKWFMGLPIPLAAGVLISLVMFHQSTYAAPVVRQRDVAILTLLLSYLMVSNVRYRTFKQAQLTPKSVLFFVGLLVTFMTLALWHQPPFALLIFFSGYVALGLFESILSFGRPSQSLHTELSEPTAATEPEKKSF